MRNTLLFALLISHCLAQADTLTGRVVRVTDGDTIVVLDSGNAQHKIRLTGIDAPERGQAFGTKSTDHLSDSVAGKFGVVEYNKRDRYQRILGKVLLSDQDMNLEQVKAGLAWHYKYYQKEQPLLIVSYTRRQRTKLGRPNVAYGMILIRFHLGNTAN
jgi:endonuclease YncB( thermonuclease family)